MKNEKSALRKNILKKRDRLSPQEISKKSSAIQKLLFELPDFQDASLIMFYVSFRSEVETTKMIKAALSIGKQIAAPAVDPIQKELEPFPITDLDALAPGNYGILEPRMRSNPLALETIQLVIVPGCVFDLRGFRLGYGVGYYDRLLQHIPSTVAIGLAYELQLVQEVPCVEPHDQPVDKIVTEKSVIYCQRSGPR